MLTLRSIVQPMHLRGETPRRLGTISREKLYNPGLSSICWLANMQSNPIELIKLGTRSSLRVQQTFWLSAPAALRCLRERRAPQPAELRTLFERLGVSYVKLAQFFASAPALLPDAYTREFERCLDDTRHVPFEKMKRVMEQSFARPLSEIFSDIDPQPLASASIAQVHRAHLLDHSPVVVKIQKPGVLATMQTDLFVSQHIAKLFALLSPAIESDAVDDIIAQVNAAMLEECDFEKERENLRDFRSFLDAEGIHSVVAPEPLEAFSTREVLTMREIKGVPVSRIAPDSPESRQLPMAMLEAFDVWYRSLRRCKRFHADLHSGNLLLQPDGTIAFIDFGLVGELTPAIWQAAKALIASLANQDFAAMADAMTRIGMTRRAVDKSQLEADLRELIALDQQATGDDQLAALSSAARRHGLRFPSAFTLVVKQLLYFEKHLNAGAATFAPAGV